MVKKGKHEAILIAHEIHKYLSNYKSILSNRKT